MHGAIAPRKLSRRNRIRRKRLKMYLPWKKVRLERRRLVRFLLAGVVLLVVLVLAAAAAG